MQSMEITTAATTISPAIAVTTPLMVALAMTPSKEVVETTQLMAEMIPISLCSMATEVITQSPTPTPQGP